MKFVSLLVLAAACTSSSPATEVEDYLAALDHASCEFRVRCGLANSLDACVASIGDAAYHGPSLISAAKAGVTHFEADKADACLQFVRTRSCSRSAPFPVDNPCDAVFAGTVADGDACFIDEACAGGNCHQDGCTDDPAGGANTCCAGVCQPHSPRAPLGASCATLRCTDDAFCNTAKVCVKRGAAGTACTSAEMCDEALICQKGACTRRPKTGEACDFSCDDDRDSCIDKVCARTPGVGASCDGDFDCNDDAYCDGGVCAAKKVPGDACADGVECSGFRQDCTDGICKLRDNDLPACY